MKINLPLTETARICLCIMCLTFIATLVIQKLRGKPLPFASCSQSVLMKWTIGCICLSFLVFLFVFAFAQEKCYNVDQLVKDVKVLKTNGKVTYHRVKMLALNTVNRYKRDDVRSVFKWCETEVENWKEKIQCLSIEMTEVCPELKPLLKKLKKFFKQSN